MGSLFSFPYSSGQPAILRRRQHTVMKWHKNLALMVAMLFMYSQSIAARRVVAKLGQASAVSQEQLRAKQKKDSEERRVEKHGVTHASHGVQSAGPLHLLPSSNREPDFFPVDPGRPEQCVNAGDLCADIHGNPGVCCEINKAYGKYLDQKKLLDQWWDAYWDT